MTWETVPAPNYAAFDNSNVVGNALGNLVSNYQQAQQGQQRTQANDLRNQQDKMLLDQSKAFAGGLPMNPDGTPNYSAIMKTLAEKGDINAVSSLAPILQQQQNLQGANAPDPILGGAGTSGSTVDTLASNIASRIETKGQSDPYDALGPITKSGDRAYGKYQVMGENIPSWTEEILGVSMTPDQFLADPQAQEVVAHAKLGQYIKETGSPADAASMWFTGKPLAEGANRRDQNGVSGAQYAATATAGMGGGSPVEVASLDPSSASAYANSPDQPSIPPVSAAAGSSIPRADASIEAGAVGGSHPKPSAVPPQLAANNPAWGGINVALPVGPAPVPAAAALARAARPPATQGSVASLVSSTVGDPQRASLVAGNVARLLRVDPNAPLTPEQAQRAQLYVKNYAQRTGQSAPGGQGQPSPGGPIIPQFPLPKGFTDPQQAILAIDQDIARLSRFGPAASGRIRALEDMRDRIAKSSAPLDVHAGQTILDPRSGKVLFQAAPTSANNLALQRFLSENPNATPEQIQSFVQAGRGGSRSGVGMYMQRFLQENPNATAEQVAKAAQDFQSGSSALTRFTSGTQGNSIRSFNVLVDHLGTLGEAAAALKNGNMQVFNRISQGIAQQTGSPAPTNFDGTKRIVANELVKAITGGGGALGDRDEIDATVDKANSPAQLAGVIDQYKKLALGQLRGLSRQYSEATGRDDFDRFLAPGTRAFFGDKGADNKSDSGPSRGGQSRGGGAHPPGNYNYDPATGNLEPVK